MKEYKYYEIGLLIKDINGKDSYFGLGRLSYNLSDAINELARRKVQYPNTIFKLFGHFSEEIEL